MKIKFLLPGLLLLLVTGSALAQQQDSLKGSVSVLADPRIESILERRLAYFEMDSSSQGYRIQILMCTDHKEAMLELENFALKYPDLPVYRKYDSPNFKLRVGDFSSKVEAHYWFMILQEEYKNLFLVPDKVFPKRIPG